MTASNRQWFMRSVAIAASTVAISGAIWFWVDPDEAYAQGEAMLTGIMSIWLSTGSEVPEEEEGDTHVQNGDDNHCQLPSPPSSATKLVEDVSKSSSSLQVLTDSACEKRRMPWECSVHVSSYGCSHNTADGESMRGLLQAHGFKLEDDMVSADAIVINSCTVKNPSQDAAMNLMRKCLDRGQAVVLGGCVPQADQKLSWLKEVSLVGTRQLDEIGPVVEAALNGERVVMLSMKSGGSELSFPKIRRNDLIEIIPINQGCLGRCTYCKTRFARGKLLSYPKEAILERVRSAVNDGVTQIWITSEDTGAYGLDFDQSYILSDLLDDICDLLESMPESKFPESGLSKIMVRVGMTNPPYILNQLDRLAKIFQRPQMFRFLHLPVQSGSESVVSNMIRDYTVKDFYLCVKELRDELSDPPIKLCTDLICGFPFEEQEDHNDSLELIHELRIDSVNISQYYARPGTPAAKMPQVPKSLAKQRTKDVTNLFESYTTFDYLKGTTVPVWFSEKSDRSHHVVGHTEAYVKVLIPQLEDDKENQLIGRAAMVEVLETTKWHIVGRVVEEIK